MMSNHGQTLIWVCVGIAASGCSEEVQVWRVGASCPIRGSATATELAFGRSYQLEVPRRLWGEPPAHGTVREGEAAVGQVALDCVTRGLAGERRFVRAGGAALWDRPTETAPRLGELARDLNVVLVASVPPFAVVATDGATRGFVHHRHLAEAADTAASVPGWLADEFARGGVAAVARAFADLHQNERQDAGVRTALAGLLERLLTDGQRQPAAVLLRLFDLDELSVEPYLPHACAAAFGGLALDWNLGGDLHQVCDNLPQLPDTWGVAVSEPGTCPPETELLGQLTASTGLFWACHTPDAELIDEPSGDVVDLAYETRLEHLYVRDRHDRLADLLAELSWPRLPREGRWQYLGLHEVGLGACIEYQETSRRKTRALLSCFPPPPAHATSNRLLLTLSGTRTNGTAWRKEWAVVRDRQSFILCAGNGEKLDDAWRFVPGKITPLRKAPAACKVTDRRRAGGSIQTEPPTDGEEEATPVE